jgi:energy-coupling factor transporter ATP-binding protein EcfA2
MNSALIRVDDLSFTYPDGTAALQNLSFTIAPGEKVALMGANGAGKSTLLMVMCGVLHGHVHGRVELFGLELGPGNLRQIRQKLGVVFQNPDDQLFCPTVMDDVAFGPRNMKLGKDEVDQRSRLALAAVGLAGFEQRSPFHLSLGEKRRAAIATVISMRPELLVLDEPTSLLDGRGRREVMTLLETLGGTQLIISHDLALIGRLCNRAIVLSRGQLVADRPAAAVLADTALLETQGLA